MESYTIEHLVQMIKLYYKNQCSLVETLRALRPFYDRRGVPSQSTLQRLVTKFETTGSVSVTNQHTFVRQRNARSAKNIDAVRESVKQDPSQSIPRRAQELGLSQTSIWRILRRDLGLNPNKYEMQMQSKTTESKTKMSKNKSLKGKKKSDTR